MKPEDISPDFPDWPNRWRGDDKDTPYGQGILDVMRLFVEHLIAGGLSKKTIRRHMDNLWLLGGEIIRDVNTYGHCNVSPLKKLKECVGHDGGPYCQHIDDDEGAMNSYDATCRKLHVTTTLKCIFFHRFESSFFFLFFPSF